MDHSNELEPILERLYPFFVAKISFSRFLREVELHIRNHTRKSNLPLEKTKLSRNRYQFP